MAFWAPTQGGLFFVHEAFPHNLRAAGEQGTNFNLSLVLLYKGRENRPFAVIKLAGHSVASGSCWTVRLLGHASH